MKNTCYIWPIHLTKMTILTKCQAKNLVKMDKCPSKWPWFNQIDHLDLTFNQIGHIEWIRFSQTDHAYLTFSQIDHYDLTYNQMNHTHLMT